MNDRREIHSKAIWRNISKVGPRERCTDSIAINTCDDSTTMHFKYRKHREREEKEATTSSTVFWQTRFPSAAIFQRRARLTTLWKSEFMKASRHFYPRAAVKIYNLFEQVRASPRPFVFSPRDDTHSRFLRNSFHPLNVADFYKYKHTRCKSFE